MLEKIFLKNNMAKNLTFLIIAILFIIFITRIQDIAIMFFASYVIACSLNPLVDKLEAKVKKRSAAAGIVLLSFVAIVLAFLIPIIILLGSEIKTFSTSLPNKFNDIYHYIIGLPFIGKFGAFQLDWHNLISTASSYTSNIINEVIDIGINVGSAFIYLIVSLIIIYYFMADKELVRKTYLKLFPHNLRERADEIINIISKKIGGYIVALIATVACVGIIMTLGLSVFRVEYAVILGLITAILDVIPIVGPTIAFIICIIAIYEAGWGTIAAFICVFAIAQLVENQFVRPYVFGKLMDVHPIMIYLFLFITAKYIGPIGVIFAPAIAATVCVLIEEIYIKSMD